MSQQEQGRLWQSVAEFERDPAFLDQNEFAEKLPLGEDAHKLSDAAFSRRDFLKVMGFGTAAAMTACTRVQVEKAIPYVVQPEEIVPGKAFYYASTCGGCATGCGILVKTREGRPIKIEGNPDSPVGRGGLCAVGQAGVLELYDSGRLQAPVVAGKAASWQTLDDEFTKQLRDIESSGGQIRLLTASITSPSTKQILADYLSAHATAKHVVYDAVPVSGLIAAHEKSMGKRILPHFHFDKAKVIASFGADFLGTWISPVEFTKQYTSSRKVSGQNAAQAKMSHHVQFESAFSLTGANADVRVAIKPSEEGVLVLALLDAVLKAKGQTGLSGLPDLDAVQSKAIQDLARQLVNHEAQSLVVSGSNDINTQLAVLKLNDVLGNYGHTLHTSHPSNQMQGVDQDFVTLLTEMEAGQVAALVLVDANPVYSHPWGERFAAALKKVQVTASVVDRLDETASLVHFVAPHHHYLESWNDAEPLVGSYQLSQPTIPNVYDTRETGETLLKWLGQGGSYLDYVKSYWQKNIFPQLGGIDFDYFWRMSLKTGAVSVADQGDKSKASFEFDLSSVVVSLISGYQKAKSAQGLEVVFYESVNLRDGQMANNPWLQELPDPISKVTWDNYVSVGVTQAREMGLKQEDVVNLTVAGKTLALPVYLQPGQAYGTVAVALGYGRTAAGKVGNGVGKNAYPLVSLADGGRGYAVAGATLSKTGQTQPLAQTQTHYSLEGRPHYRETTLSQFQKDAGAGNHEHHPEMVMLWEEHKKEGHAWGMAVDLNACTGCSACLVGCQAENNVAVVGRDEVAMRREMHWLRIDRYFVGNNVDNPEVAFQPMMCQHCGNAPCESVCPVAATVHSQDGLNQQVYNRCVGTRYCGNNCPYKVRRFNWFNYALNERFDYYMNDNTGRLVLNPDVVVRSRGVMEKCSMCVQRIQDEKNVARAEDRLVQVDQIKTACQQSCPADAIVFGDLNDDKGRLVNLLKANQKRNYHVLEEVNTRPVVSYFTKVRNKA